MDGIRSPHTREPIDFKTNYSARTFESRKPHAIASDARASVPRREPPIETVDENCLVSVVIWIWHYQSSGRLVLRLRPLLYPTSSGQAVVHRGPDAQLRDYLEALIVGERGSPFFHGHSGRSFSRISRLEPVILSRCGC